MGESNETAEARRARPQNSRPAIGLLLGNTWYSLSWDVWSGADEATREHDANLLCFAGDDLRTPFEYFAQANVLYDLVSAENVDGLVISSGLTYWPSTAFPSTRTSSRRAILTQIRARRRSSCCWACLQVGGGQTSEVSGYYSAR